MPPPVKPNDPNHKCKLCNKPLRRKLFSNGRREDFGIYSRRQFCGIRCSSKARTGIKLTAAHRKKLSLARMGTPYPPRTGKKKPCKNCGRKFYCHPYEIKKRVYCSSKCRIDDFVSPWKGKPKSRAWKKMISKKMSGKNCHFWKGGRTKRHKKIRHGWRHREWRLKVFRRDDFTCQECGKRGCELHPHHIKPFAKFPKLRFTVSNGLTLCDTCHRKTPTWGRNGRAKDAPAAVKGPHA